MACGICGEPGGYECPTCACDYCVVHYFQFVKRDDPEFLAGKTPYDKYSVVDGICERCNDEL